MIKFHQPYQLHSSQKYIQDVLSLGRTEGDGVYTKRCQRWLETHLGLKNVLMMTSGSHSLECACQCLELELDDEVIVPSYNFPSAANAVIYAGGRVVFSEVESTYLTLDPEKIEEKITPRTKGILVTHYGGFLADMKKIMAIARRYHLQVIEDSAQSFLNPTQRDFETIGDYICYSFHGTKDIVAGEGGALYVKENKKFQRAKCLRQKGTNREAFLQGDVAFYEWVDLGSSYSPSEILMALLWGQLELAQDIVEKNRRIFQMYQHFFEEKKSSILRFSREDQHHQTNGHTFYLIFNHSHIAQKFKAYMRNQSIDVRTHFVPLGQSKMAETSSKILPYTSIEEENIGACLIRLPVYPDLNLEAIEKIIKACEAFLEEEHDFNYYTDVQ